MDPDQEYDYCDCDDCYNIPYDDDDYLEPDDDDYPPEYDHKYATW